MTVDLGWGRADGPKETMIWTVDGLRCHCRFTAVQWWSLSTGGVPVPDLSPKLKDCRTRGEERE